MIDKKYYVVLGRDLEEKAILKFLSKSVCTFTYCKPCLHKHKYNCVVLAVKKDYDRFFPVGKIVSFCDVSIKNSKHKQLPYESLIPVEKEEDLVALLLIMDKFDRGFEYEYCKKRSS